MKRLSWPTVGLGMLAVALILPMAALAGQDKIAVCHVEGNGTYHLIEIADPAYETHIGHGDADVGETVPGQPGFVFDAECNPVMVTCPCWTPEELAAVGVTYNPHAVYYTKYLYSDGTLIYELDEWYNPYYPSNGLEAHWLSVAVTFNADEMTCRYYDRDYSDGMWSGIIRRQVITPAQAQECLLEYADHAAAINVELTGCNVDPPYCQVP